VHHYPRTRFDVFPIVQAHVAIFRRAIELIVDKSTMCRRDHEVDEMSSQGAVQLKGVGKSKENHKKSREASRMCHVAQ
jgi:hypothetical protein